MSLNDVDYYPISEDEKSLDTNRQNFVKVCKFSLLKDIVEKGSIDFIKSILFDQQSLYASTTINGRRISEIVNEDCDDDGNTPLIISAKIQDSKKLIFFLNIEADVNKTNNINMRAVDFSWENKDYFCVLELLSRDSYFPDECSTENIQVEGRYAEHLKKFISKRENLHNEIEFGNLENVKVCLKDISSKVCLSANNFSAIYFAGLKKQWHIYTFLLSKGLQYQSHEEINHFLTTLDQNDITAIQRANIHKKLCISYKQSHIKSRNDRIRLLKKAVEDGTIEDVKFFLFGPFSKKSSTIIKHNIGTNLLNEACDEDGNTPLLLSAKVGDHEKLIYFLKLGAEVNIMNFMDYRAINYSWKSKDYFSVLELLRKDSYFYPFDVKPEDVQGEDEDAKLLKEFIESRRDLHLAIERGNLEDVKKITANHDSEFFLSPRNVSALYCASKSKNTDVHAFLLSKGVYSKNEEEKYLYDQGMTEDYKDELKMKLEMYVYEAEEPPSKKLFSKSYVFGETHDHHKIIEDLYQKLESSVAILPILQVLQFHPNLHIIFSFNCKSTMNKDLDEPDGIKGSANCLNGEIHVAAKGSNIVEGRSEVLGTLAHEMAHQAIDLIYNNQFNPYLQEEDDTAAKIDAISITILKKVYRNLLKDKIIELKSLLPVSDDRFINKVKERAETVMKTVNCFGDRKKILQNVIAELNQDFIDELFEDEEIDTVIKNVFTLYRPTSWHKELIVRIPHMIANYGDEIGMEKIMKQVPELFDFYKIILKSCEQFLSISPNMMKAMRIFSMNENLGIIKSIQTGKIWLQNLEKVEPLYHQDENIHIVKTSSIHLCTVYFYQILQNKYKICFQKQCLFIKLSIFENNMQKILDLACSEACKAIVLISDSSSCDIQSFKYRLFSSKAEIYFIVSDEFPLDLATTIFEWNFLTTSSRKFLMDKKFIFYGKSISLNQFNVEAEFLDSASLAILIEERYSDINDETESVFNNYDSEYYIDRYFCKQVIQKEILLQDLTQYILYITNVSVEDLYSLGIAEEHIQQLDDACPKKGKRILVKKYGSVENYRSLFSTICERFREISSRKPVHWLNMENSYLIWKDSSGDISNLKDFVNHDIKIKYKWENDFNIIEENKKIMILADYPGMGKSTLLAKLQERLKNEDYWVLRFNLVDFVNKFKAFNDNQGKDEKTAKGNAIDIISNIQFNNSLVKSIFKLYCRCTEKVVLIFDGFDEIPQNFKMRMINLIKSLKSSSVHIWISTRFSEKRLLEKELQVLAYTLNFWDRDNQISFVSKFWKNKLKCLSKEKFAEKLNEFQEAITLLRGSNCLENNQQSSTDSISKDECNKEVNPDSLDFSYYLNTLFSQLNDTLKMFTLIPLHSLMLANIVFEKSFKLEKCLNIYELYKHFVLHTFQRFYAKCRLDFNNCSFLQELLNAKLLETCQFIVRDNLKLNKKFFPQEIIEDVYLQKVKDCLSNIGVSTNSGQFIHKTIAEYLFVEWIFENSQNETVQKLCFDTILLDKNYNVVRQFISSRLERIYNNNEANTSSNDENSYYQCEKGFLCDLTKNVFFMPTKFLSILEKIAAEGLEALLKFCFDKFQSDVLKIIHRNKQNILHYTCKNGRTNILDIIFQFIKSNNLKNENIILNEDKWSKSSFQYALNTDDEKLVQCFIKNTEMVFDKSWTHSNLIFMKNEPNDSALHRAASNRKFKVLKYLWNEIVNEESVIISILKKRQKKSENVLTHIAAYNGCSWLINEILKTLVEQQQFLKEILNSQNIHGFTVLHAAALSDDLVFLPELKKILEGLNWEEWYEFLAMTDKWDDTALHKSAYRGHTGTMIELLNFANSILNETSLKKFLFQCNLKGYTALHKAAKFSNNDYFSEFWDKSKTLLGMESFLNLVTVPNKYGNTILHTAAAEGNHDIVDKLFKFLNENDHMEFILKTDSDNDTILHKASIKGNFDVLLYLADKVEKKLRNVKFFCKENRYGSNIIHLAVRSPSKEPHKLLDYAHKRLNETEFKDFMMHTNSNGDTFIHKLATNSNVEVDHKLLNYVYEKLTIKEYKDFIMHRNSQGDTFIHKLATNSSVEVVHKLLECVQEKLREKEFKDLMMQTNSDGDTFIHKMAKNSSVEVVDKLLDYAYENLTENEFKNFVIHKNSHGDTFIHKLAKNSRVKVVHKLLECVQEKLSEKEFKDLMMHTNSDGDTFIHKMATNSSAEVVHKLSICVQKKLSKIEFKDLMMHTNSDGDTFIHKMATNSSLDVVNKLLDNAYEKLTEKEFKNFIMHKNSHGDSFIHNLATNSSVEFVHKLLGCVQKKVCEKEFKDLMMHTNSDGDTFIHKMAKNSSVEVVHKLLDYAHEKLCKKQFNDLMMHTNDAGDTFIHALAANSSVEVFSSMCDNTKTLIGMESFHQLLTKCNNNGCKVLEYAANTGIKDKISEYLKQVPPSNLFL